MDGVRNRKSVSPDNRKRGEKTRGQLYSLFNWSAASYLGFLAACCDVMPHPMRSIPNSLAMAAVHTRMKATVPMNNE
jgi:hypothetical protein